MKIPHSDLVGSEYGAAPQGLLTFNPAPWGAVEKLKTKADLEYHHFLGMPDARTLYGEHAKMMNAIRALGVTVVELSDLWYAGGTVFGEAEEAETNPNLFFTRDSSITLPFEGAESLVIPTRMTLQPRQNEPALITETLNGVGFDIHELDLEDHDSFEGGDVIPITLDGKKTLLVGIGKRTKLGAAKAMADELGEYVDQVIAIAHPKEILHLDTGLTFYAGAMVVAEGMLQQAAILKPGKAPEEIEPNLYLEQHGFEPITVSQAAAIEQEVCNVLPLGKNQFLGFEEMGYELINQIHALSGATVHTTPGGELALAAGGVHCSTRPIYGSFIMQALSEQGKHSEQLVPGGVS